jgi:hypothetical protein
LSAELHTCSQHITSSPVTIHSFRSPSGLQLVITTCLFFILQEI